jgi:hypothetical protein
MQTDTDTEFDLEVDTDAEGDFFDSGRPGLEVRDHRVAIIRTSDRATWRRCRRKHSWTYSRGANLRPRSEAPQFWLGSGMHFALEDYHGYRNYTHPRDALAAYSQAISASGIILPADHRDLLELGQGMLDYYEAWLETREPLQTLWIDGVPQVEVNFYVELPKDDLAKYCPRSVLDTFSRILYSVTFDRVIIDPYNRLWLMEYKSAKNFQHFHLDTDSQVTSYLWAASLKYRNHELAGCIYQQHKKQVPTSPPFLASTGMFSVSKRLKTTYALYHTALRNLYGSSQKSWPAPNLAYLEYLREQETQEQDSLIRRDWPERNQRQIQAEYQKILMETGEILNPNTPIYPNPMWQCAWDCPFVFPCVQYDAGEDYLATLRNDMMPRDAAETRWRDYL